AAVLGVELILQLGERLAARRQRLLGARLILGTEVVRVAGGVISQAEVFAVRDAEMLRELLGRLEEFLFVHSYACWTENFPPTQRATRLIATSTTTANKTSPGWSWDLRGLGFMGRRIQSV